MRATNRMPPSFPVKALLGLLRNPASRPAFTSLPPLLSSSGLRHQARCVESHFPHRTFQGSRADRLGLQSLLSARVTENDGRLAVEGVFGRKGELDWEQNWGRGFGLGRRPARRALESIGWLIIAALALSSDDPLLEVSAMCPKPIDEENLRSMEFPQVSSSSQCKKFPFFLFSPLLHTYMPVHAYHRKTIQLPDWHFSVVAQPQ